MMRKLDRAREQAVWWGHLLEMKVLGHTCLESRPRLVEADPDGRRLAQKVAARFKRFDGRQMATRALITSLELQAKGLESLRPSMSRIEFFDSWC